MKLFIASDLHGSYYYAKKMKEQYKAERADRLILLGDLLYHGPRNDLPAEYDPKKVTELLNGMKNELLCVRGNCEAEVDQMVLDFPVMADYALLWLGGRTVFTTHGHLHNEEVLPPLGHGDILLHGHTHVLEAADRGGYIYLNPGSLSIPKEGNPGSYMIFENNTFSIKDFNGNILKALSI